jgi:hypothetical protein
MLTFDDESSRKMLAVQRELAGVLRRVNDQKLEAALAAFALVRLARELLDKYPEKVRSPLVDVVVGFLEHRDMAAEGSTAAGLLIN